MIGTVMERHEIALREKGQWQLGEKNVLLGRYY